MPSSNNGYLPGYEPDEETEAQNPPKRKRRRKKNRTQQYMMMSAFAIAAVLLIVCLIMIIRAVGGGNNVPVAPGSTVQSQLPQSNTGAGASAPAVTPPVAPNVPSTEWNLALVGPSNPWSAEQVEANKPELTNVRPEVGYYFDSRAAKELEDMIAACDATGNSLYIVASYRDYSAQAAANEYYLTLYTSAGEENAAQRANMMEPPAGQSEHHTGLAVDLSSDEAVTVDNFANTPQYAWLMEHAAEYGFVLRYPEGKEGVTGQSHQPWHFRYVGKEAAAAMKQAGTTLEEYLGQPAPASQPASASQGG